jgi:hypothetical protein
MIWDIAAVIGFVFLCVNAFIGVVFTWRAWVFTGQLAIQDYKHNKLKGKDPEVALKMIINDIEKERVKNGGKSEKDS